MAYSVIGSTGMVGSAIVREIKRQRKEAFPGGIFMCAGRVSGIRGNIEQPVAHLADNLNIYLEAAQRLKTSKVLFFGSSCMYPKDCRQPMREKDLWTGKLEPTNEGYAVAKLAGLALCQAYAKQYGCRYITAIPCNLYGPGDHYEPQRAHVIPALITKFKAAKEAGDREVKLMGSGKAIREFMHVDDLAEAAILLMEKWDSPEPVNVGSGEEVSIHGLASLIASLIGYQGKVTFAGGPDGMARKVVDSSKMRSLGWEPKIGLLEGLAQIINDPRRDTDLTTFKRG
jgi:GDP-L-fucose synthase